MSKPADKFLLLGPFASTMPLIGGLVFAFLLVVANDRARADERIDVAANLDNAKGVWTKAIEKANDDLLSSFDKAIKSAAANANADAINAEKDAFKNEKTLPHSKAMLPYLNAYLRQRAGASGALFTAYDKAASAYTKQSKTAEVIVVQDEKKQVAAAEAGVREAAKTDRSVTAAQAGQARAKNSLSSLDLDLAYQENEIAADQKYKDKTFDVAGEIKQVGKTADGGAAVRFESTDRHWAVVFYFSKAADVAELGANGGAVLSGKCEGSQTLETGGHLIKFSAGKVISFRKPVSFEDGLFGH